MEGIKALCAQTGLLLDAFTTADVCLVEVQALTSEMLEIDLDPLAQGNCSASHHQANRSAVTSLLRWTQLASTVAGVTSEQVHSLLEYVREELGKLTVGDAPNAARIQNWYLDPTVGHVTPIRQRLIDTVPQRSVGSNGARARQIFRLPADATPGPGSSPSGLVLEFKRREVQIS